jgi:RNA polymerase sigma factor FliA
MQLEARCRQNAYKMAQCADHGVAERSDNEEFILCHLDLVKYLALRLAPRLPPDIAVDDLINSGIIGLMDAIDKFDPSQQIQFRTYAKIRIKGAMLDEIRSMDWVPRSLRQKSTYLDHAHSSLQDRLGRPPTDEELATELYVSLDGYYKMLDEIKGINAVPSEILDMIQEDHQGEQLGGPSDAPFKNVFRRQVQEKLSDAITLLPKNEQMVLSLYYYEELTMKEIGGVLGYTESRISQLHAKALLRLRTRLSKTFKKDDLLESA